MGSESVGTLGGGVETVGVLVAVGGTLVGVGAAPSIVQNEEHPSPFAVLPSSHCSGG
jgi:hypothetical protein